MCHIPETCVNPQQLHCFFFFSIFGSVFEGRGFLGNRWQALYGCYVTCDERARHDNSHVTIVTEEERESRLRNYHHPFHIHNGATSCDWPLSALLALPGVARAWLPVDSIEHLYGDEN